MFISGTMIRIEFERGYIDAPIKDGLGGGAQLVPLTESTMVVHPVDPAAELAETTGKPICGVWGAPGGTEIAYRDIVVSSDHVIALRRFPQPMRE